MRHRGCDHTLCTPGVALLGEVVSVGTRNKAFAILFSLSMLLLPYTAMAEGDTEQPTYRVYGSLFNELGEQAGSTSVKVNSFDRFGQTMANMKLLDSLKVSTLYELTS